MLNLFQWHNGINLMNAKAPPKEPHKCALNLLDMLFQKQELGEGILFQSRRSNKPALDEARVSKMFGKFIPETHSYVVNNINNNKTLFQELKSNYAFASDHQ